MSNILIRNPSGKILLRGGGIAIGPEQCCSPCNCGGCSGGAPLNLLAEVDASLAFGNYNSFALGCGGDPACSCYGCTLASGSYAISGGLRIPTALDTCAWESEFDAPGYQAICNGNQSDNGEIPTEVRFVVVKDVTVDSHYRAYFTIYFGGYEYVWSKDLGEDKPACSSIFPITFGQYDSHQQPIFEAFGEVFEPCDMRLLDITVDVA